MRDSNHPKKHKTGVLRNFHTAHTIESNSLGIVNESDEIKWALHNWGYPDHVLQEHCTFSYPTEAIQTMYFRSIARSHTQLRLPRPCTSGALHVLIPNWGYPDQVLQEHCTFSYPTEATQTMYFGSIARSHTQLRLTRPGTLGALHVLIPNWGYPDQVLWEHCTFSYPTSKDTFTSSRSGLWPDAVCAINSFGN